MSDQSPLPYLTKAANFVAHFEGFSARAYWDVNAWRLGFGSDTRGASQIPVKQGDETTYADALDNLSERLMAFASHVTLQVGQAQWDALPDNQKVALLDFAYNYGSLTPTLARLVRSGGNTPGVVQELKNRGADNGGINMNRRYAEAGMFASEG